MSQIPYFFLLISLALVRCLLDSFGGGPARARVMARDRVKFWETIVVILMAVWNFAPTPEWRITIRGKFWVMDQFQG